MANPPPERRRSARSRSGRRHPTSRRAIVPEDVEVICALIRQWPNGRITWNALVASVAETLGHRWTRQALERHAEIKDAFQARKAAGRIAPPMPVDPAESVLRDRIDRLTRQVAELQQRIAAYEDLFVRYQYNAHLKGITVAELAQRLPRIEKRQTDGR